MIEDWQPMELPLGLGIDLNSNRAQLPPGQLRAAINLGFNRAGQLRKRLGFDTHLGDLPAGNGQLFRYQNHLLGTVGKALYDYAPPATGAIGAGGSFINRGTWRSVPTRTRIAKSASVNIPQVDCVAAGNYSLLTWFEGANIKCEVIDETTHTVVSTQTISAGTATSFHTVGYIDSTVNVFAVAWGGKIIAVNGTGTGGWTWSTVLTTGISPTHVRLCLDNQTVLHMAGISSTTAWCLRTPIISNAFGAPTFGTVLTGSTTAVTPDVSSPAVALTYFAGSNVMVVGYNNLATGNLNADAFNTATSVGAGAASVGSFPAPNAVQHLSFTNDGTNLSFLYDEQKDFGLTTAKVLAGQAVGSGPNGVLFRGCSLLSDARYNSTGDQRHYFGVLYSTLPSPDLSNSGSLGAGSTLADGSVMTKADAAALNLPTLNSTAYVVTADGQICARVLRAASLTMPNTASFGVTSAGGVVIACRGVSLADTINIQQALSFGAAAVINFDLNLEYSRVAEAFKLLWDAGGSVLSFDGTSPVEHGFSVFPEMIQANNVWDGEAVNVAANHNYSLGDMVCSGGVGAGTSLSQAFDQAAVWAVVAPGKTNGSPPTFQTTADGQIITNGASFQRIGPRAPHPWVGGVPTHAGFAYAPTVANGNWYVMAQMTTDGHLLPAESTVDWSSATTAGAIVAKVGGGQLTDSVGQAIYLVCMGPLLFQQTGGKGYAFAACYSWVNDQGQLMRSALSPAMTCTIGTVAPLLIASSLRMTTKLGARVEFYSTDADGTVLQLIAIVPNNSAVDAVMFLDRVPDSTQETGAICYQGPLGAGGLPDVPPPSCTQLCAFGQRIACNNQESPYAVHLSQLGVDGFAVAWADNNVKQLNGQYGNLNALMTMDDKLCMFQDRSISVLTGAGPDNTGGGSDWNDIQVVSSDVGCQDASSLMLTPLGIVFRSPKGWYLLDRSTGLNYLGEQLEIVSSLNSAVRATLVDPTSRQLLILASNGGIYAYSYQRSAWATWVVNFTSGHTDGLCEWQGKLVCLSTTGSVYLQSGVGYTDPDGNKVAISFEIAGARLNGVQGYGRVRGFKMLFESSSGAGITCQIKNDFNDTVVQTTSQQTLASGVDSFETRLANQKMTAIGLAVSETAPGDDLGLLGLVFDVGVLAGTARKNPLTKRNS